jgi:hypothetical protein
VAAAEKVATEKVFPARVPIWRFSVRLLRIWVARDARGVGELAGRRRGSGAHEGPSAEKEKRKEKEKREVGHLINVFLCKRVVAALDHLKRRGGEALR